MDRLIIETIHECIFMVAFSEYTLKDEFIKILGAIENLSPKMFIVSLAEDMIYFTQMLKDETGLDLEKESGIIIRHLNRRVINAIRDKSCNIINHITGKILFPDEELSFSSTFTNSKKSKDLNTNWREYDLEYLKEIIMNKREIPPWAKLDKHILSFCILHNNMENLIHAALDRNDTKFVNQIFMCMSHSQLADLCINNITTFHNLLRCHGISDAMLLYYSMPENITRLV
jgi:hypothetical protein